MIKIYPVAMQLHTKILIGMGLGVLVGGIIGPRAASLEPFGMGFIRLISMIIIPLIFASLFVGVTGLGQVTRLGRLGLKTLTYFVAAAVIAISISLILSAGLKPGAEMTGELKKELLQSYAGEATERARSSQESLSVSAILLDLIPPNPVQSAANGHLLQLIFFALVFAVTAGSLPKERAKPLIEFFGAINDVMVKIVDWVMALAPYGVFALVAAIIGKFGLGVLMSLLRFSLLVMLALGIHLLFTYNVSIKFLARQPLMAFFRSIRPAQLIAFGTTSSAATLPVSMRCSRDTLGISDSVTSFVLPLGASLSHDGSAIYQVMSTVFIAQVYGHPLAVNDYFLLLLMGTLLSFGTAAVPAASIINITVLLKAFGLPLEGLALILGVDRILDMFRTALNVTGQLVATTVVAASEGEAVLSRHATTLHAQSESGSEASSSKSPMM